MQETEKGDSKIPAERSDVVLLQEESRQDQERYLRLLADFDNYRRRVDRERASAARSSKRGIMLSLLGVLDDFERALQHVRDEPPSVTEGLQAIHRKLAGVLEAEGVTPYNSVGEPFNPDLHEAIGSVASSEYPPGVVAEEARRGYRWGDDVLRPARVVVAR
jgi:molecular chaperone GrpE